MKFTDAAIHIDFVTARNLFQCVHNNSYSL